jgi:AcrR family transcriptional regulator
MSVTPTEPSAQKACKRAEIVTAAVRIADADGVDAVSMRRLADELGVATMTPYTHVASKDELLDLMRDAVAAEMLLPEPLPEDWRAALRAIADRTRAAFEAHPWCLDTTPRRPRARINRLRHVEQSIGIVLRLGLPSETSRAVLLSIDDYVIGYCTRARARQRMLDSLGPEGKDALRHHSDPDPEVAAALDAGELPMIKAIAGRRDREHTFGVPPDSGFEPGLDWLLDGIEASVARAATH